MALTASAALNFRPPVETTTRPRRFFNTALRSGPTSVSSTLLPMTSALNAVGRVICSALRNGLGRTMRPNLSIVITAFIPIAMAFAMPKGKPRHERKTNTSVPKTDRYAPTFSIKPTSAEPDTDGVSDNRVSCRLYLQRISSTLSSFNPVWRAIPLIIAPRCNQGGPVP